MDKSIGAVARARQLVDLMPRRHAAGEGHAWPEEPDVARATFRRGWVLTDSDAVPAGCSGWSRVQVVGPWSLHTHPDLEIAASSDPDRGAVLLGNPLDCRRGRAGARAVHRELERAARASPQAATDLVHALSGRFVALVWGGAELVVLPDPAGTMPFFWTDVGGCLTVGSWSHQVAETANLEVNTELKELLQYARDSGGMTTVFAPGTAMPFHGLRAAYPNHGLWLSPDTDTPPAHRRTYPGKHVSFPETDEAAYAQFVEAFEENVRLATTLGRVGISLTSGVDSNATLSAARDHLGPDSFCWTYHRFDPPHAGMTEDLLAANRRAFRLGLPHAVLGLGGPTSEVFDAAYARTMGKASQFPALAAAYFDDLPQGIVQLQGMVAEVGTGFYKRRDRTVFDAPGLAGIYAKGEYSEDPRVVQAFDDFIDYADFDPELFGEVDPYDLFYWEMRVGRWASRRIQECDFSHRLVSPFNDRRIIEALQVVARSDSYTKSALSRYIAEKG